MERSDFHSMPSSQKVTQAAAGDKVFTFWQATTFLPSTILSVGILTLPRTVAEATGTNGIEVVLVSGLLTFLGVWIITKLCQTFPGKTFVSFTQRLLTFRGRKRLGYWLALPIMAAVTGWWVMAVMTVVRLFGELQHSVVLPHTPIWFEVGAMLIVSMFVASNRAEVIARLNEFLFPIIIVPMLAIALLAFKDVEWTNLLPLFDMTWGEFWKGTVQCIFSYQGISVLLIFMASYQQPEKAVRSHAAGIGIVTLTYFLIIMATMGVFSYREVKELTWPVLDLVKNTRFPGLILERIESGFLILWVIAVFTTLANLLTAACHLIGEYLGVQESQRRWVSVPLVIIIFVLALWPEDLHAVFELGGTVQYFGSLVALVIPAGLLLMARVRRIGSGRNRKRTQQENH